MADHVGDTLDVDVDDFVKSLCFHLPQRRVGVDCRGVIDQQVWDRVSLENIGGPCFHPCIVGNIDYIEPMGAIMGGL